MEPGSMVGRGPRRAALWVAALAAAAAMTLGALALFATGAEAGADTETETFVAASGLPLTTEVGAPGNTVTVEVVAGGIALGGLTEADGWAAEVEQAGGLEVDVDFRGPNDARATYKAQIEDGEVRIRVRIR